MHAHLDTAHPHSQTLGKMEGRKRKGKQRIKWLGSITHSMDINLSKLWEK